MKRLGLTAAVLAISIAGAAHARNPVATCMSTEKLVESLAKLHSTGLPGSAVKQAIIPEGSNPVTASVVEYTIDLVFGAQGEALGRDSAAIKNLANLNCITTLGSLEVSN